MLARPAPKPALGLLLLVALALGAPSVAAATQEVQIIDFNFDPKRKVVAVGDEIRWTNVGNAPHTTTSDEGLWDSGTLANGDTFTRGFGDVGTFPYRCSIHDFTGTIVVDDPAGAPDLVVAKLEIDDTVNAGVAGISARLEVKNVGTKSSPPSHMKLYYVDHGHTHQVLGFDVPELGPGESEERTTTQVGNLHIGTFEAFGVADDEGDVAESDESNNVETTTFTVLRAGPGTSLTDPLGLLEYAQAQLP